MFSQTTEYALRAVVWLGAHPGTPLTTEQIAEATKVPPGYLSKVLQTLGRGGLVVSQPGPGGGYRLRSAARELTVLEVISLVEPFQRIRECPLGLKEHGGRLCKLHYRLDAAQALVEDAFRGCTIADLFEDDPSIAPLCVEPPV